MIAIPNTEIPDDAVNVELAFRDEDGYIVWHMFDIPLIKIVTCGECKHSSEYDVPQIDPKIEISCDVNLHSVSPNDFCSYGERRE